MNTSSTTKTKNGKVFGVIRRHYFPAIFLTLLAVAILPSQAQASGEIPTASSEFKPRSGETFYSNGFSAANWAMEIGVSAPNPPNKELLPTRNVDIQLPGPDQLALVPPASMPVCPDDKIGPKTDNSQPIEIIVARCSQSVLGNGLAKFLLGRNNQPGSNPPEMAGQVVLFNGGFVNGQPRIKFWAYSYDTGVAIYTESVLSPTGMLPVPFPVLSYDSAVSYLRIEVPGRTQQIYLPPQDKTITLPGGRASNYVQVQCKTGTLPFSATFLLGRRTTDGNPYGDQFTFPNIGSSQSCTGALGKARIGGLSSSGSKSFSRGKPSVLNASVANQGILQADNVSLSLSGPGISGRAQVGKLAAGERRAVKISFKPQRKGKIKAQLSANSSNGGSQKITVTLNVR